MNRRVALAKHWFLNSKNDISFAELLSKVLEKTSDLKAKPFISEIQHENGQYKVDIKNIGILYYPDNMPIKSLYQVITESTDKEQWHYYEIPETQVAQNDVVVDCGAAEGLFSLIVAKRCAKVYAIEPLPSFNQSLKLTFAKFQNVELIACALSNKSGNAFMNDHDISSAISDTGNVPIKIETIDNLFFNKGIEINYLKADLEGYEMDMLKGATKTIKRSRPKVAITTYHKAEHAHQIREFLLGIHPDYKIKFKGIEERAGAPVMLHAW
ncbi:FkbM family methyltransferase [Adhaeribacter radiodurans]|uniref:FkbM family methyltransferase n=1 Tax=Adhaeribacter radiodurans TaxID=2745197 RepID=A0A7L7L887_9BACT|nr:FkbM family methyltransferase [Adhaeribacter radiodurans]QMU28954.1 FkbM family methyltransferase [Adhaeribacter radiodurans]